MIYGLEVARALAVRHDAERHLGYLEAHIEQGPYLEFESMRIGVVTAIIGMRDFDITFAGQQNHAGTTPMPLRRDAGTGLIEFCHRVHQEFPILAAERTVWTIGKVDLEPGAPSIIPGKAQMLLQFRDPDEAVLDTLEAHVYAMIQDVNENGTLEAEIRARDNAAVAAAMDEGFQAHLAQAAEAHAPTEPSISFREFQRS